MWFISGWQISLQHQQIAISLLAIDISQFDVAHSLCGDVTRDNSQRRFLAQYSVATLLRYFFEWLQHCFNIAMLCCARNCRCELSRVTSPLACKKALHLGESREGLLVVSIQSCLDTSRLDTSLLIRSVNSSTYLA